jgi:hypothetical protein
LYEDHKSLEKIAKGNLKGHGWEYSSADEFNRSDAELSRAEGIDDHRWQQSDFSGLANAARPLPSSPSFDHIVVAAD